MAKNSGMDKNGKNSGKNGVNAKIGGKNDSGAKKPKLTKAQKKKEKEKKKWKIRIIAVVIVGIILAASLLFEEPINKQLRLRGLIEKDTTSAALKGEDGVILLGERLNIHFVDVGQGDACILELPDERTMIIDGGKDKDKTKLLTYIEENIFPEDSGETNFDYAILTHSDEDHCGGLDDVLSQYPADVFYRPNQLASYEGYTDPGRNMLTGDIDKYAKNTRAYKQAIEKGHAGADTVIVTDARKSSQNVIKPQNLQPTDAEYYTISFYTPTKDSYNDVNDYSPIIILEYQGKRIALSGDAEAEAEKEFVDLAKEGNGRYDIFTDIYSVDLIKLGHHGSRSSSSEDYLNAITTPSSVQNVIIVISCGAGNSYGHPHSEVISRLLELGFKEENILRTDINGNIAMSIREDEQAEYQLYHGAEMIRVSYNKPIAWREIAIIIFIAVFALLIITPLLKKHGKKLKLK